MSKIHKKTSQIKNISYTAGIRRKELISLKVSDIDLKTGLLKVTEGKGGKGRTVPVGTEAMKWTGRYMEVTRPKYLKRLKGDHLFITERGEALKPYRVNEIVDLKISMDISPRQQIPYTAQRPIMCTLSGVGLKLRGALGAFNINALC